MPSQASVQNNFNGGLKTEFTGLNFPENACTELDNCVISLIGDIFRREGIDYEVNAVIHSIDRTNAAISSYRWTNVGGDGQTQIIVVQVGGTLYFFQQTNATIAQPLSTTLLGSIVNLSVFSPIGASSPNTVECQYSDGYGYLFVFHPNLEPFFCTFNSVTKLITPSQITIQVRDFLGINEPGVPVNLRPTTLTVNHQYNLNNQGWVGAEGGTQTTPWTVNSTTQQLVGNTYSSPPPGNYTWAIGPNSNIQIGETAFISGQINIGEPSPQTASWQGAVVGYTGSTITVNVTSGSFNFSQVSIANLPQSWSISSSTTVGATGLINTWHALGNYPSNADVWWTYKDTSGNYNPTSTIVGNFTLNSGPAPKGYFILDAFNLNRGFQVTGLSGITPVTTLARPSNGTWFQGRVFYTGVNDSTNSTPDGSFYTWTESIYFSQVIVPGDSSSFGKCYQTNDPTSETLFDLLPTDGGVIVIQGSGTIYKLFPLQTGMLVFAANGIWYITGGQGGFEATNYTISKISNVISISSTSFINVLGFPFFWNEEGIYSVHPSQNAGSQHTPDIGLEVMNIALGTFLTFYLNIPLQSKKFARGDYDPLGFVISWAYRSINESSVTDRYQFDGILNYNTANKAMYPYSITSADPWIHDIKYVVAPGGTNSPDPTLKYLTSIFTNPGYGFTFSEERDNVNWVDWFTSEQNVNYVSSFLAGYNIKGQAQKKWQPGYVYIFSNNSTNTAYQVYGIFDYGSSGNTGKQSSTQVIHNDISGFNNLYRRHRIRGRGLVFQLGITSVDGQPFDIIGWSIYENVAQGV